MTDTDTIIDAVILWVDGNDEKHRQKMLPYLEVTSKINEEGFRTRFDQVNEIDFTVNSILKFAPFIRNIFIVTDDQIPNFYKNKTSRNNYDKVVIVDHKEIFQGYEEFLPTFNNRSIESCIHRIPNLAEHFIYMNDDFFIINETKPTDFFRNGLPVLRGKWLNFDENIFYKKFSKQRFGHKYAQQSSAKRAGMSKYYNFRHTPHPLRKSTLANYFSENKNEFLENIKHRFRKKTQFLPQGLSNHLEIKNETCYLESDLRLVYFRSYKKPLWWYKYKLENKTAEKLFMGLQSLDQCPEKTLDFFINWLRKRTS
ncbi:Stealth protein CR1, conserved region 1 [Nonlabens sp. Hel1_33_55]|uniref:Stealth CR1 domain-containing protein n=1 Tax=Nonlabens sp. Hel1_33_55 TaxID=1336802 RepID=UPI000875ECD9|nr:Stealth CR1 domain-containing protein [Nonlabens sp. Hel1_33_55]SCX89540.1 Stealth protein CR1, conserved region 1 [Nonlabens sp. Hel1_33_55]